MMWSDYCEGSSYIHSEICMWRGITDSFNLWSTIISFHLDNSQLMLLLQLIRYVVDQYICCPIIINCSSNRPWVDKSKCSVCHHHCHLSPFPFRDSLLIYETLLGISFPSQRKSMCHFSCQ